MASQRDAAGRVSCSRFEELFAASPRAKEIFASIYKKTENEPTRTRVNYSMQSSERSNLETSLQRQTPVQKKSVSIAIMENLPDQPSPKNDRKAPEGLTRETPDLIGEVVVSKTVEQSDDSSRGNNIMFPQDDEEVGEMDSFSRNVVFVLKRLDEVEKGLAEQKITQETNKKEQVLCNWSLRTVKTDDKNQIIVEGHRSGDPEKQNWRSTVICERISAKILRTKSGSLYHLEGKINEDQMLEKGYSKRLINAFKCGFPTKWKMLLQTHFKDVQSLIKKNSDIVNEKNNLPKTKLNVKRTRSTTRQKGEKSDTPVMNDKTGKIMTSEKTSQQSQNSSLKKSEFKTPPTSEFPKNEEVKRSRSGRIIAPPLEYWRGQRMIASNHDDTISIVNSHLEERSVRFVKLPTPLSRKMFWQESPKDNRESVKGVIRKRISNGFTSTDSTTTGSTTTGPTTTGPTTTGPTTTGSVTSDSESNINNDIIPISTVVKTLTYTSTDSTSSDVYDIPSKIPRKEQHTTKKSNKHETETNEDSTVTETNEDSTQSGGMRNGVAKKKWMFNKKEKKVDTPEKEATSLVELEASEEMVNRDDKMVTGDSGKTEDNHHEIKDVARETAQKTYCLRKRDGKKLDSRNGIVSQSAVSKIGRNATKTTRETSQRKGNARDLKDTNNNNKVKVLDSRIFRETDFRNNVGTERKGFAFSCVEDINAVTKRTDSKDTESSETESVCQRAIVLQVDNHASRTAMECIVVEESLDAAEDELLGRKRRKLGERDVYNAKTSSDQTDTSEAKSKETKRSGGRSGGKHVNQDIHKISSSKGEETSDSSILTRAVKSTNRNVKRNTRSQVTLQRVGIKGKGSVDESDGGFTEEIAHCEISNVKPVKIVAQKTRVTKNRNIGKKNVNSQPSVYTEDDEMWVEEEHERLIQALSQVHPTAAMYWQKIARLVKTRSAVECQLRIQNGKGSKSKRPTKKVSQKTRVPEKLTAKVGTLARKRQLRDILEQQDDGYEDDLYDSTPFRNQGLVKFSPINFNDEDFVTEDVDTDPASYKTPSSRTPMNRLRPAGPLSTSGASETEHMTPALLNTVNRNEVDRYVHQLKKRKVGRRNPKQTKSHTPIPKKISAPRPLAFDVNDCFDIREDSCSETEEDYYWSDA